MNRIVITLELETDPGPVNALEAAGYFGLVAEILRMSFGADAIREALQIKRDTVAIGYREGAGGHLDAIDKIKAMEDARTTTGDSKAEPATETISQDDAAFMRAAGISQEAV